MAVSRGGGSFFGSRFFMIAGGRAGGLVFTIQNKGGRVLHSTHGGRVIKSYLIVKRQMVSDDAEGRTLL